MIPPLAFPLVLAPIAPQPAGGVPFEVEARPIGWSEVSPGRFDFAWRVPETRRSGGRDLVAEMRALVALRFELGDEDDDAAPLRSFGDVAARLRDLDDAARRGWLDAAEARAPELFAAWGPALRGLLLDDALASAGWDPDDDLPDDGVHHLGSWDLAEEGGRWAALGGEPRVEQGAVLVWSDLATFKEVENDYARYHDHVDNDYEEIRPVDGSYFRGVDEAGRPFSVLDVYMRSDLPFPFTDYECTVHLLNRVDAAGDVVTDVYSTSGDFHWIAGRDVFLRVDDGSGAFVATLAVRLYGFDLDGVPDRPSHRRAALRRTLGNLKRDAERRFRELGSPAVAPGPDTVPAFRARGLTPE